MMLAEPKYVVQTQDLTRVYGDGQAIRALDGINLRVKVGEFVAIMGPSGCGKSTLLNIIGALDKPSSGRVIINDVDLAAIRNIDRFRAKTVGFVFQLHNLLPTLTALENVEVPMMGQIGARARRKRAEELLVLVGLPDRMDHLPNQLSGGQRQRVAVARALANSPTLLLADEPTGSLDTAAGQEVLALLRQLNREQGTTIVVVTHDPGVARQTDRLMMMMDGKIVHEDRIGSPLEEDLKLWRNSGLGRKILNEKLGDLNGIEITPAEIKVLRDLLSQQEEEEYL